MLSALRARRPPAQRASDGTPSETKSGVYIYNGNPGDYHEWEFRTRARHAGTKEDDKAYVGPRILEGLKDDAYLVAKDFGLEALAKEDGVLKLIDKMRAHVFPSMEDEAQLLYHHGQKEGGMLSRQSGESMFAYVGRRRRWWDTLQQLDDKTIISENIRADLLLQLSGLDHDKQLLIKTSVQSRKDFEEIAQTLVKQHPKIHARERRRDEDRTKSSKTPQRKPYGKGSYGSRPKSWGYKNKKFANIADEDDEEDSGTHESNETESSGEGAVGYHADEDEETSETIQMEVLTAYMAQHTDWDADTGDLADACVDQIQCELMSYFARGKAKGKGVQFKKRFNNKFKGTKGVPTLEDRREKLKALKKKSKCKLCGKLGHWAGDPECSKKERAAMLHLRRHQSESEEELVCEPCRVTSSASTSVPVTRGRKVVVKPIHIDDSDSSSDGTEGRAHVAYMASRYRMDLGEEGEYDEADDYEYVDATPLPGSDTKFTFGQYKGWTYNNVLQRQPGYAVWALRLPEPSPNLKLFIDWVNQHYDYDLTENEHIFRLKGTGSGATSAASASAAAQSTRVPAPGTQGKRRSKLSELRKDPDGPCRDGCDKDRGTFAGSNVHIRKFTCYKCGHSQQQSRECVEPSDPALCQHTNTDHRGSTKTVHKTFCKDCQTVVEEMSQDAWKERQELGRMAAASSHHTAHVTARAIIQENIEFTAEKAAQVVNLIHRLQTREVQRAATAGRTVTATQLIAATEDAIDTFVQSATPMSHEQAMGSVPRPEVQMPIGGQHVAHMAIANELVDSNYFAALAPCTESEEDDSDDSDDEESDDESGDGGPPRLVSRDLIIVDDPDVDQPIVYPLMAESEPPGLPWVDIYEDPGIWAVLDEGCNSTCHGEQWARNAEMKLNKLGYRVRWINRDPKTYKGVGQSRTVGKKCFPFAIELIPTSLRVPGTLTSHELKQEVTPLLLSLPAQARLGLCKDERDGTMTMKDYPGQQVKLFRDTRSQLKCFCISKFLPEVTFEALRGMRLDDTDDSIELGPAPPSPEDHVAYAGDDDGDWQTKGGRKKGGKKGKNPTEAEKGKKGTAKGAKGSKNVDKSDRHTDAPAPAQPPRERRPAEWLEPSSSSNAPSREAIAAGRDRARREEADCLNKPVELMTIGLSFFENTDTATGKCKVVHAWMKAGHKAHDFDTSNEEHIKMVFKSLRRNYPHIFDKYGTHEIFLFDTMDFDDAAKDPELKGHIGWHWKNMQTTVNSAAFKEQFPQLVAEFDDMYFNPDVEKVLVVLMCKSGRHRSECTKKITHNILKSHGVKVDCISTSEGKYWEYTCKGECPECAEGNTNAQHETAQAINKAKNMWIATENRRKDSFGVISAYATTLRDILAEGQIGREKIGRRASVAAEPEASVTAEPAARPVVQPRGSVAAEPAVKVKEEVPEASVTAEPAQEAPDQQRRWARRQNVAARAATEATGDVRVKDKGKFRSAVTEEGDSVRDQRKLGTVPKSARQEKAESIADDDDDAASSYSEEPKQLQPGETHVGVDSASDSPDRERRQGKKKSTAKEEMLFASKRDLDIVLRRMMSVFVPDKDVEEYRAELADTISDTRDFSMIEHMQHEFGIRQTTLDAMFLTVARESEPCGVAGPRPVEEPELKKVYRFPNSPRQIWQPKYYREGYKAWQSDSDEEAEGGVTWGPCANREEYIETEIRADLRKFCSADSPYGVTIPDLDVFNLGMHQFPEQDIRLACALGADLDGFKNIVIPKPELVGGDAPAPKPSPGKRSFGARAGSSREATVVRSATLVPHAGTTWRERAAAARGTDKKPRIAQTATEEDPQTREQVAELARQLNELQKRLDSKRAPEDERQPTPEKRQRGVQEGNIYRVSRMSDDELNALFDDKEKNFKTYIGPMTDQMMKIRVDGKIQPKDTWIRHPPQMNDYTKYTMVQWNIGDPWRELENGLWISEGETFKPDDRPERALVFAVPPDSEQYKVAYMHTIASPLTSRSGIMTRKQHQDDQKHTAYVNRQDESLCAFLSNTVRSWKPKIMAFGVVLACLATSLTVSGDQTGITGWANPEWQETKVKEIDAEDPDLLIFDPGFCSNYSEYDQKSLDWIQRTCEQRLDAGKSILVLDSAFTQRWNEANWKYLLGAENALTGEAATRCCCRGDLAFMTDSVYLNNLLHDWSKTDDKHWCPRSIDDTRDEQSGLDRIVADALNLQLEDADAYCAFPAEMLVEEGEERGPIDCVEGPEDIVLPETGETTQLEEDEQNLLDEMPLPGMPQDEAERRRLWAEIPRRARAAIRRMHRMIGHKPKAVLLQILKGARASNEYINAAKSYRCDDCAETGPKVKTHPVKPPSLYAFNYELHVDVLETYDDAGTRYSWLSIVDCGTTFHIAILIRVGGGTPTSRKCYEKFVQHWVKWAGWPTIVTADRGTHNRGVFSRGLAAHGVYIRPAGLESPEQIGRGERHGSMFKNNMKRCVRTHHIVGKAGMKIAGAEIICGKNDMIRRGGFSPSQWVLGKAPRGVGHLLDEDELGQLGVLEDRTDPASEFAINAAYRMTARKGFVNMDCSKRAAKLMLRNSAPLAGNYSAGDMVCFRKEQGSDEASSVWSAPARIIGFDNKTTWVSCENLPVATALDKLRPCTAAEVLAYQVLNREALEHGPPDDQQRFLDHRRARARVSDREAGSCADSEDSEHEPQADASGGGAVDGEPMGDAADLFDNTSEEGDPSSPSGVALSLPPANQQENVRSVRPRLSGPSPEESRVIEPEQEAPPLLRQWEQTGTVGPGVGLVARMHPPRGAPLQATGDEDEYPPPLLESADDDDLALVAKEEDSDDDGGDAEGNRTVDLAHEASRRIRGLPPRNLWTEKLTEKHLEEFRVFFANRVETNASQDYLKRKAKLRSKYAAKKRKEDTGKLLVYERCSPGTQAGLLKSRATEWDKWQQFYAATIVAGVELQKLLDEGYQALPTQWIETDKNAALRVPGGPELEEKLKSRLVGRGDLEDVDVRSDSPTCETEATNLICSFAASRKLVIKCADITNAYFQGEELDRLLLFKQPKGGLPGVPEGACMIARVPVYGTKDAGRGFWKRLRTVITTAGFRENYVMRALYHYTNEEGRILAMMGTHVDDVFWANEPVIDHLIDKVLNEFNVGKKEQGNFRFCGDEFAQDGDSTIRKTCTSTAKKLKPVYLEPGRKSHQDANETEKVQMKSVAASLGWCARQVGPQYSYRVSKAKKTQPKATVKDVKDMNKLVEHVVETADRGLTFKAGILDWDSMDMEMITVTDASHANEEGSNEEKTEPYRSQGARLNLLATPGLTSKEECSFHLIGHQSTEVKRVCRATVQAEAYAMQNGTEEGDRLRAAIADARGMLDRKHWEATAAASMRQIWITDCKSVFDSLVKPKMAKMSDKRLGIEIAAMRQSVWRQPGQDYGDPLLCDELPINATDVVKWIDTDVMLADPLTKAMDAAKLMAALDSNWWSIVQPHESIVKKRAKQLARSKTSGGSLTATEHG